MVSSIAMRATMLACPTCSGTNLLVGQVLNYMQVDMCTDGFARFGCALCMCDHDHFTKHAWACLSLASTG